MKMKKWNFFGKWKVDFWRGMFAVLFGGMLTLSCHIVNMDAGTSSIATTYVVDFHWFDFFLLIVLIPFCYLGAELVSKLCSLVEPHIFGEKREKKLWLMGVFAAIIFLCWIPYMMSFWPGGIYADTVDSLNIALGQAEMDNHNPILYTLLWRLMFRLTGALDGGSVYTGLKAFTVLQCLLLAVVLAGFVYACYKRGMKKIGVAFCLMIAAIFPMYPFYGISLWKDTIFSVVVFLFTLYLYGFFREWREDISLKDMILYGVFLAAVAFLRNNGIYVDMVVAVVLVLVCFFKQKTLALKMGGVSLAVIVISGIIQGPVYQKLGYDIDSKTESMGVPIQQVAYIISTDGDLSGADMELLDTILPLESWKEKYNPLVADSLKFDPAFNREFFEENSGRFFKEYLHLVMHNPVKAVKAYLLETLGFWDISESSGTAYICNFHFGNADYFMSDYFDYYFDLSFQRMVEPKKYISSAVFVWLMLFTAAECLRRKNYKGLLPLMPTFGIWVSIMIATPVAFSFRYVYALFLCVPVYLMILLDSNRKRTGERKEEEI